MTGSVLVNFTGDTYEGLDSGIGVSVNSISWATVDDCDRLYTLPVRPNDVLTITAAGRPDQDAFLTVYRRDYTTINENGDNGIKDTLIYSGTSGSFATFTTTATTLSSSYDFEYRLDASVLNPCYDIGSGYTYISNVLTRVNDVKYKNNKIYTRGLYNKYNGIPNTGICVTDKFGVVEPTFISSGTSTLFVEQAIEVYSDGKILTATQAYGPITTYGITRINSNGTIDSSFSGFTSSSGETNNYAFITDIELQSDDKILICGVISKINGISRQGIARLNTDGSLDTTFGGISGFTWDYTDISPVRVRDIDIQSDNKILAIGHFNAYSGVSRNNVCRLNSDGTIDTSFTSPLTYYQEIQFSNRIKQLSSGKILIAGKFNYDGNDYAMMRLNSDGSVDNSFYKQTISENNGYGFSDFDVMSNGKIVVATGFIVKRLNEDGDDDNSFNVITIGNTTTENQETIVINEPDERIYIGGSFQTVNGLPYNRFVVTDLNGNLKMC